MGEEKNPISSIYTADRKMGMKKKNLYWKRRNRDIEGGGHKKAWKAKGREKKDVAEVGNSMKRTTLGDGGADC